MISRSLALFAASFVVVAAGCRRETVESYRIPKEKDPEMPALASKGAGEGGGSGAAPAASLPANNDMANTAVATATGAGLTWTAPAGWREKPLTPMRKGSYAIAGEGGAEADFAITAFPGDVGGELGNVNRWRGQVQQPPIGPGELAGAIQRVKHNGLEFGIVDILGSGEKPQRILGAYVPHGGSTWFFKIQGPEALVAAAKPAFLEFLATVKPATSATQ